VTVPPTADTHATTDALAPMVRVPSPSQRRAIEAAPGPLLVLAGPGAGKTYCLTERIGALVERHGLDPARVCAFTFTNKAAGEIAHRLAARLGDAAERITRGTLHAFCAQLLRERGTDVGLRAGFGIADEAYQLDALRRLDGPKRWHRGTLTRFAAHRLRGDPLLHDDQALFDRYERYLAERNVVDFDTLLVRAADLLERTAAAPVVRARWDAVLVDEFQDLNPVQYRVIAALARDHRHVFAVGDDEQSIYSWAGADPSVFRSFVNDFGISARIHLEENRRCPHDVFALARRLVTVNTPIFADRVEPRAERDSPFPVAVLDFASDDAEIAWIVEDLRRDRVRHGHAWGDVALLYRKHEIGDRLETAFVNAGIPCRLAQGRALAEDPAIAYVLAALRVIASPDDEVLRDAFFGVVLPRPLFEEARAKAEASRHALVRHLHYLSERLPRGDEQARHIRRALYDWRNLAALGRGHSSLGALIQELLSRRVGATRSVLDDRHDEITDPAELSDVVALAERLRAAREERRTVWLPRMGGVEIALEGMLATLGLTLRVGGEQPSGAERVGPSDVPSVGIALGVFKAAQLLEMAESSAAFTSFTAIDLETTDRDTETAEIVEIAAVRVRDGRIVDTFTSYVKPRGRMAAGAMAVTGIRDGDLAAAPRFEDVWPRFRRFCGDDVIVAHNGYEFDFRILKRIVGKRYDLCTYDTLPLARHLFPTSAKLGDLARRFDVSLDRAHRALDDTRALAEVALALDAAKLARARKTALVTHLDRLGLALALCDEATLCDEARMFRDATRAFALGRYSTCLEAYERAQGDDLSIPTVDEVIERLGGMELLLRVRAGKSADERYPAAMVRLRRLVAGVPDGPLAAQLAEFLERAVLSRWDGHDPDDARVNLLTLHSTKGLEFSRVYVVGAEDGQLLGNPQLAPKPGEVEEARRLLYVGMTRTVDRLVLTRVATRSGKSTGGHQFLDEMGLAATAPA